MFDFIQHQLLEILTVAHDQLALNLHDQPVFVLRQHKTHDRLILGYRMMTKGRAQPPEGR